MPGLIALSTSDSRLTGKRLHSATRRRQPRANLGHTPTRTLDTWQHPQGSTAARIRNLTIPAVAACASVDHWSRRGVGGTDCRFSKLRPRMRQQRVKLGGLVTTSGGPSPTARYGRPPVSVPSRTDWLPPATRVRMRLGQRTAPPPPFHLAAECGHRPGQPDVDDGQRWWSNRASIETRPSSHHSSIGLFQRVST